MTADDDDFDAELLRRAIGAARLAIIETDATHRLVRANRYAATLFGYPDAATMVAEVVHARVLYARESDRDWLRVRSANGEDIANVVIEMRRRDGSTFWACNNAAIELDAAGAIARTIGWIFEVGGVMRAGSSGLMAPLREHFREADFLGRLADSTDIGIYETEGCDRLSRGNPALARIFGFPDFETMRRETDGILTQIYANPADHEAKMAEVARTGTVQDRIWEAKRRDGGRVWVRESALRMAGQPVRFIGTVTDVTALVEAWAEVRRAEASYRSLFENAAHGMFRSTPEGKQLRANPALVRLNGYANEAELLAAVNDIATEWYVEPGRRDEFKRRVETEGRVRNFESEIYRHKTRERIWVSESAWVVRGQDGRVLYYEGMIEDISERRRVEQAFVAAKAEAETLAADYRSIYDNANVGIFRTEPGGRQTRSNLALARLNGFATPEEQIAAVDAAVRDGVVTGWYVDPERRKTYARLMAEHGRVEDFVSEIRRRATGEQAWVSENAWAVRDAQGNIVAYEGTVIDVTTRVRAECALAAAKAEAERLAEDYRSIYNNANIGIYRTALDGQIERLSLAMARVNGFRSIEENLAAIEIPSIGRSSRGWYADPARRDEIRRILFERGRVEDMVSEIRRRATGERAWVRENAWIVRDANGAPLAIEGTVVEVTELMRSQGELAAAKAEAERLAADYRSIFDNANFGIYRTDAQWRQTRINPALARLNGLDIAEQIAVSRVRAETEGWYVEPGRRAEFRAIMARDGRIAGFESEIARRADGTRLWISENAWAVRDRDGNIVAYEGMVEDITARKRAEAALREAKAEAEAASAAKSAFLAVMSHELRTPLNAIIGFAEIVAGRLFGPNDPRYFEYAEHIRQSGTHLLTLINDILDLSKIGAGQFELHESTVDLAVLAGDTVKLFAANAGKGGVALSLVPDFPGLFLRADALRLKQVAMNLVSNAIKFTKPGGRVTLGASAGEDTIRFWVEDTGIGMTAREAARAIEPFVQIDDGLARKHGGTGLGLPISKELVALHGGRLIVTSEKGKGTRVTVELPVERRLG